MTGIISKIVPNVVDGNSHYYIMLEGTEEIFDVLVSDMVEIIKYEMGHEITMEYEEGKEIHRVISIQK